MKKCKYCQSEIDVKAKICPNCKKKQRKIPIWLTIIIVILVIAAIGNISNDTNNNSNNSNKSNNSKSKITTKKEEKFSIIEGTEKGYSDDYGFAYYIEGTIQNNTDKTYSYVQVSYNVYDSSNNNLGTCIANNNNLGGKETWKYKAICSGDAKSIVSYKLNEIKGW